FFFFQAEDGIRDRTVTGVQTCALPISLAIDLLDGIDEALVAQEPDRERLGAAPEALAIWLRRNPIASASGAAPSVMSVTSSRLRSEERRVGEEGRDRGRRRAWSEQARG